MKKCIILALAALFVLGLAACGNPAAPRTPTETGGQSAQNAFTFNAGGEGNSLPIPLGGDPAPVLAALGQAADAAEKPSCASDAKDVTYFYPDFELTVTYPDKGAAYITGLRLLNDNLATPEGIYMGSSADLVEQAYGTPLKRENGFTTYKRALSLLEFAEKDGEVIQIIYGWDWDNA